MARDPDKAMQQLAIGTLIVGGALAALPDLVSRLTGTDKHAAAMRAMGLADLALAPALLFGRPRWVWAVVRVGLTLVFAGAGLRWARADRSRRAAVTTAGLVGLAVQDALVAKGLKATST